MFGYDEIENKKLQKYAFQEGASIFLGDMSLPDKIKTYFYSVRIG